MRIRNPKTTALIFKSGKMVVLGAKNEIASKQAAKKFTKILQKFGYQVKFKDFRIVNIVSTGDLGFKVRQYEIQR
jgi:transcription initiation factor TFIID TATA-box-binding protein